jgi:hypothetical protein
MPPVQVKGGNRRFLFRVYFLFRIFMFSSEEENKIPGTEA